MQAPGEILQRALANAQLVQLRAGWRMAQDTWDKVMKNEASGICVYSICVSWWLLVGGNGLRCEC